MFGFPAEPPHDEVVAAELLELLRDEAGASLEFVDPLVQFVDPLVRIDGGIETFTYGFKVSSQSDPSGPFSLPLILRLFRERADGSRARAEAVLQNALAGLGYPVPRVVLHVGGPGIEGRPFNIVERVSGRSMSNILEDGSGHHPLMPVWLAHLHTDLHDIPAEPVIEAVEGSGLTAEAFSIWPQFNRLDGYFEDLRFDSLLSVRAWLQDHRPAEREIPVVCHGDFHPSNIIIDNSALAGVIDWSDATFTHAEYDVARTLVVMGIVVPGLLPDTREFLEGFRGAYLHAYEGRRGIDHGLLAYYEVMGLFTGLVWGTASMVPGVLPELSPRDGHPWANDWILQQGATRIEEITGRRLCPVLRRASRRVQARD